MPLLTRRRHIVFTKHHVFLPILCPTTHPYRQLLLPYRSLRASRVLEHAPVAERPGVDVFGAEPIVAAEFWWTEEWWVVRDEIPGEEVKLYRRGSI